MHTISACLFLLITTTEIYATTKRYEQVGPGEGVVIEQKNTVNSIVVVNSTMCTSQLVIYGSINNESYYYASANESYVYEGEGINGIVLGTLFSLDSSGPINTNSCTVTIFSKSLSNGGFLVRLAFDIQDMDYSFVWFANHQESREISLKGYINLAAVTILDTTYSETEDFLYMDSLKLLLKETVLYWNAATRLSVQKNTTDYFQLSKSPFNCRQSISGRVNTFVVEGGTARLHFIWWNTTFDKEVFVEGDHFFMHTSDYGNWETPGLLTYSFIPTYYPSGLLLRGTGIWNISYVANYPQWSNLHSFYPTLLFGSNFEIQYNPLYVFYDGRAPGEMEVTVVSQLPCNFMGPGIYYTCIHEFFIVDTIIDAITQCSSINGTLPIFHDYEDVSIFQKSTDISFLKPHSNGSNFKIWLGFKDGKWLDGSTFKAEGPNYTALTNSSTSLVYDRETGEIMEWKGPAGIICQYKINSGGLCATYKHVDYQFFSAIPLCILGIGLFDIDPVTENYCQDNLSENPRFPEPQSLKENELIYNFAKIVKTSQYVVPLEAPVTPKDPSNVFLNYQGTAGRNCSEWPVSGQKMTYTNFIDGFDYEQCSKDGLCLTMRLRGRHASKWEFRDCSRDDFMLLCVKKAE